MAGSSTETGTGFASVADAPAVEMAWETWSYAWYGVGMAGIATVNIFIYLYLSFISPWPTSRDRRARAYQTRQLWLSGVFVCVCAFRAYVPTVYLHRTCFIDSDLSNIFLARCLASVAELCFIAQVSFALLRIESDIRREHRDLNQADDHPQTIRVIDVATLSEASASSDAMKKALFHDCDLANHVHFHDKNGSASRSIRAAARLFFAWICLAEIFSFAGTLTTDSFWFMLEEGSWVLSAFLLLLPSVCYLCIAMRELYSRMKVKDRERIPCLTAARNFLAVSATYCLCYCPVCNYLFNHLAFYLSYNYPNHDVATSCSGACPEIYPIIMPAGKLNCSIIRPISACLTGSKMLSPTASLRVHGMTGKDTFCG